MYLLIKYFEFRKRKPGYDILLWLITNIDVAVKLRKKYEIIIKIGKYHFYIITIPELQKEKFCEAICILMRL